MYELLKQVHRAGFDQLRTSSGDTNSCGMVDVDDVLDGLE